MADIAAPALNVTPHAPLPMSAAELAKRGQIAQTAKDFEGSFLTVMLGQMMKDVKVSEPFGGGEGEEMFKSFMNEAMAKQVVKSGGVGIADDVAKDMLTLQGLS